MRTGRPGTRPTAWSAGEAFPVFVLAILGTALLGVPLGLAFRSCGALFSIGLLAGDLAFVGAVVAWVRFVSRAPLSALGAPRQPVRDVLVGVGVGALLLVAGGAVNLAVQAVAETVLGRPPAAPEQLAGCVTGPYLLLAAPMVVIGAPIAEETFFRGFLYQGLRRRFTLWPSIVISSVLFGAVHFAGIAFLLLIPALIVVGVGLALAFEQRRSLLTSVVAHATFNLAGFIAIAAGRIG